ncbi:hypothetical protein [Mucilaginibacter sp.]|uniref:hypothetical protein n=1 Tax=Mucilaginibacter sp. TaxID=1882438 RepID=UPI00261AC22C|nr:hypothetical protein [Mucilaginibacter sp.]
MGNPIVKSYTLGNEGKIVTTVTGDDRDVASIAIFKVNTQVYTTTLNALQLDATTKHDLIIGSLTILKGATLSLTVPSNFQPGSVFLNCMLKSGDNDPAPFSAMVAQWPLSS